MHVVFRESHGLEETATPVDLGQDPADLVVLSFSDSDLAAFAAGWRRGRASLPSLRLANLVALRHPLSVDTYIERTLSQARGILVRLIGGESYWSYGVAALHQLAKERGIALAVLPADGRDDARLDALSTLPLLDAAATEGALRYRRCCRGAGGDRAACAGVRPLCGTRVRRDWKSPRWVFTIRPRARLRALPPPDARPRALVTFYRSYLTAADTGPVDALIGALRQKGFDAYGAFATSLKAPGVANWLTAASSRNIRRRRSSTRPRSRRSAMMERRHSMPHPVRCSRSRCRRRAARIGRPRCAVCRRPISPCMWCCRKSTDGFLPASSASSRRAGAIPICSLRILRISPTTRASAPRSSAFRRWHRLATTPARDKRLAIVLSSYPGRPHQIAHAVGLDALASVETLLSDLGCGRLRCRGRATRWRKRSARRR